jgi:microcystin-dependent protein
MLPSLTIQVQGQGAVSADDENSKVLWAPTVSYLRAFTGLGGMTVYLQGQDAPGDGGAGNFYFDPNASAPDDNGVTTIQPTGITGNGRWLRADPTASIPDNSVTLDQLAQIPAGTVLANAGTATGNVSAVPISEIATAAPTGSVIAWTKETAPTGWLICDGSAVSRTTYADLFAVIGTEFGDGDGSTTFNLPDTRGYFIRGWDSSGVIDPGRTFASTQQSALQSHQHIQALQIGPGNTAPQFGTSTVSVTIPGFTVAGTNTEDLPLTNNGLAYSGYNPNSGNQVVSNETRPINLALAFIIKF